MEASYRKRKGFVKGKLPFYRSPKPSPTPPNIYISSKVVNPSQAPPPASSVGFAVQAHQDYLISPPKQMASHIAPTDSYNNINNSSNSSGRDKLSHFDKLFGMTGDEHVDVKAASYISAVQERFKLE